MIIKQMMLGKDRVFCYILACEKSSAAIIIDPCGEEDKLLAKIRELQLQSAYIVNTHCHPDHTCSNAIIKRQPAPKLSCMRPI